MSTAKVNPHRPYYTPGLYHHNYTSISSDDSVPLTLDEATSHNGQIKGLTTRFTSFASLKYFVTMLTSPFEVGTTLLQVQYSPHEDVEVLGFPPIQELKASSSFHQFEADTDSEDEGGFYRRPEERVSLDTVRPNSFNPISVYDDKNRPVHQMAPVEGGSVLDILTAIIKQPTEGWKSLFKGQRVTWVYEMLCSILRPALESTLNDLFGLYDDTIPLFQLDNVTPNITTIVFSHLVVGFVLSPLEIVRTRLVIQSSSPLCRKYNGTFHALKSMFLEEGGFKGVYLSTKNLIPTLIYHTITPLVTCSTPLLIARLLRISAADSPILYGVAELTLSTLGLLILFPIETIRKRLHCQVHDFKTTVATRPQPYRGMLDALYRILKEEGTRHKRNLVVKKKQQQRQWDTSSSEESDADLFPVNHPRVTSAWGIRGLYRGFSTQLAANVMLFIFQTMNGLEVDGFSGLL